MKFGNSEEAEAFFDAHNEEFCKFDRIVQKLSHRPDIHAFILLSNLLPEEKGDIVSNAEHDMIYLSPNCEKLFKVAKDCHLIDLIRCGVSYDGNNDSLYMIK